MKHLLLALLIIASGCSENNPDKESYAWKLKNEVVIQDGIDQAEANIIAWSFFQSGASLCGSPSAPELVGDYWVSKTYTGAAGVLGEPIYINKVTGEVTTTVRLSVVQLQSL